MPAPRQIKNRRFLDYVPSSAAAEDGPSLGMTEMWRQRAGRASTRFFSAPGPSSSIRIPRSCKLRVRSRPCVQRRERNPDRTQGREISRLIVGGILPCSMAIRVAGQAGGAASALGVSNLRLQSGHRNAAGVLSQSEFQSMGLNAVIHLRGGAMKVHIMDVSGCDACLLREPR